MFNFRLWNKASLSKSKLKCVTEFCFYPKDDETNFQSLTNLKLINLPSNSVSQNKHKLLLQKNVSFLPSYVEHKLGNILLQNNIARSSLLSLPVISKCNYTATSISSSNSNESPQKAESSVLDSMGIECYNDEKKANTTSSSSNEKSNDDKDGNDEKESAFLRSQRYAKWMLLVTFGVGTPIFVWRFGSPKYDDFGNEIKDQYSDRITALAYLLRAWKEINVFKKEIVEPSSKKLLPDPLTEPYYQPPYTLVIELMDLFLRPVYDSVSGWRFKKRPGIDYFLSQVGPPLFEIVIFTRETGMTAFPLIDSMDQKGYIMYRLFRDAARYKSGFSLGNPLKGERPKLDPYYQKDLTFLNRDLSKVILVDCDKRSCESQPENGLCLEKWDGSSDDTTLYDLASLLRTIATSNVEDVRPVLQHYAKTDKPIESFKLAQAKMQQDAQYSLQNLQPSFVGNRSTISSFIKRR